jgi:hypothetical protein
VGYLTEGSAWRQNDDDVGELRWARCSELGDMSSVAPRRCCITSSGGRAHTEEGRRRVPLICEAGEGGDALYRRKSSMIDSRVDNRHRGVHIAAHTRARWEEGGGLGGGLHLAQQSGACTCCRLKWGSQRWRGVDVALRVLSGR